MSKLERWLTLIANLSVVAGIVFLAAQMRQNTQAIQGQTRDSITEKQMEYISWIATNRDLGAVMTRAAELGLDALDPTDERMLLFYQNAVLREWENSYYQYERGLFAPDEFEARVERWRRNLAAPLMQTTWARERETFAPSFRAEIDRIVAEMDN